MRAILEPRWQAATVRVYIVEDAPRRVLDLTGDYPRWLELSEAAEAAAPTLELPEEALTALVAAAADYTPPSSALEQHRDDAVYVRDRALEELALVTATLRIFVERQAGT